MNKPRIFPKSLKIEGSNCQTSKLSKIFISLIRYICKSSENYSFTVYKYQQAEIALIFVPTSILTLLTPLILSELKHSFLLFWLKLFAIQPSSRGLL